MAAKPPIVAMSGGRVSGDPYPGMAAGRGADAGLAMPLDHGELATLAEQLAGGRD